MYNFVIKNFDNNQLYGSSHKQHNNKVLGDGDAPTVQCESRHISPTHVVTVVSPTTLIYLKCAQQYRTSLIALSDPPKPYLTLLPGTM